MRIELYPSAAIWDYFKGDITSLKVVSAAADRMAGYSVSYSAEALLNDLGLLTLKRKPNKKAIDTVAMYLHGQHHGLRDYVFIIPPKRELNVGVL